MPRVYCLPRQIISCSFSRRPWVRTRNPIDMAGNEDESDEKHNEQQGVTALFFCAFVTCRSSFHTEGDTGLLFERSGAVKSARNFLKFEIGIADFEDAIAAKQRIALGDDVHVLAVGNESAASRSSRNRAITKDI